MPFSTKSASLFMFATISIGGTMDAKVKGALPVCERIVWDGDIDDTEDLVVDAELMQHFSAGVQDLNAGRVHFCRRFGERIGPVMWRLRRNIVWCTPQKPLINCAI